MESQKSTSSLLWSSAVILIVVIVLGLIGIVGKKSSEDSILKNLNVGTVVTDSDYFKGSRDARVTLIEYSDFECPACAAYASLIERILSEYKETLRVVYRHYPLPQHQNALLAAYAAEAAGKQGKFFEMHDILFAKQREWAGNVNAPELFEEYAQVLPLNIETYKSDLSSAAVKNKVRADAASGKDAQLRGTPTFFLNGIMIKNPQSYEEFKSVIENAIRNS